MGNWSVGTTILDGGNMADVLIVDDDADLAGIVAEVLQAEGHTVRTAENGEQGLRMLGDRLPDVVVLDVEMPTLSGPEMALRMLLEDAGKEHVPIVLLSGVADLGAVLSIVGTPYGLAKPCPLARLLQMMNRALAERATPVRSLERAT